MGSTVQPIQQPAQNAPQIIVTPQTGAPSKSATEIASDEARQRIAETGTALPPAARPTQPRVPAGDPDGTGGQWTGEPRRQLPNPATDDAPPAGPPPSGGDPATSEGQQPPAGPEGAEGTEGGEGAEGGEEPPNELLVEFPVGDGEPLAVEFESPEVAAQVRELVERASAADERVTQALGQVEETQAVRDSILADPAGFVLGHIAADAQLAEHVVLALATHPQLAQRLIPRLAKLTDPIEARTVAAEERARRGEMREQAQQVIAEQRAVRQNFTELSAAVTAIIPPDLAEAQRQVLFADMMGDLQQYADRHELMTLPVEDVPLLLQRRLVALGIDPTEAAQRALGAVTRSRKGLPATPAQRRQAAPPAAPRGGSRPAAPAKPNGQQFVAGQQRRAAAVTPGAGAGSPGGADLQAPRDANGQPLSTEETIKWHRARLAKGQRSY